MRLSGFRFMRDPTRGGLVTVMHEICRATKLQVRLHQRAIPVREMLGYDVMPRSSVASWKGAHMWCWKPNWAANGCWKNWKTIRCRGYAEDGYRPESGFQLQEFAGRSRSIQEVRITTHTGPSRCLQ